MTPFAVAWSPILFGVALVLSSALLFMVQPMVGKTMLPHLGGNPVAWSACLVFFQTTLLAGCLYADLIHRFRGLRWQPWLQLLLMAAAAFLLFAGAFGDRMLVHYAPRLQSLEAWPVLSTFALLSLVIGMPVLALAAISPLLQRWFAHMDHPKASDPYFLFVASNLGGMMALIIYTGMIEPNAPLGAHWVSWKLAFLALSILVGLAALCAWRAPRNPELEPEKPSDPNAPLVPKLIGRGPATWPRCLFWLAASAVSVALLLSTMNHVSLDLPPAPVLWTLPLSIYLLSFAQSFSRWAFYEEGNEKLRRVAQIILAIVLCVVYSLVFLILADTRQPNDHEAIFLYGMLFLLMLFIPFSWLGVLQPLSVVFVIFLQLNIFKRTGVSASLLFVNLTCFYLSVRLCLGMLAKDRPAAPALTAYHVWIGIGGLVGALFQALVAPLIFRTGYLEYFVVAALASTFRPAWLANGLVDWLVSRSFNPKEPSESPSPVRTRLALGFDFGLSVMIALVAVAAFAFRTNIETNFIPVAEGGWFAVAMRRLFLDLPLVMVLALVLTLLARPLRFGLALAAIAALAWIGEHGQRGDTLLSRQRTAFGMIRLWEGERKFRSPMDKNKVLAEYTERELHHSNRVSATCIIDPPEFRRYPTAYYHRRGPVGQVMRNLEWFRPAVNDNRNNGVPAFWVNENRDNARDDARMIASLVGMGAMPDPRLAIEGGAIWSEPPYAFVGLGTGTLFTYAHPYQHVDAYELDPAVVAHSTKEAPEFHYYQSAKDRGVCANIVTGDGRRNLTKPGREGFYHVIFIDAFHSEAMPTHLLTQEAIETYFQKLAPDGVVCIHTSNRNIDVAEVLKKLSGPNELQLSIRVLQLEDAGTTPSYLPSEWVVLARSETVMNRWETNGAFTRAPRRDEFIPFHRANRLRWTDDRANLLAAVRSNQNWTGFVYGMQAILFFFGIFFGIAEIISATHGATKPK